MPRKPPKTAALKTLLDAVGQPVYVLDAEQRIVFCNRSLLDWVECQADQLVGRPCRYLGRLHPAPRVRRAADGSEHPLPREEAELDRIASGLCPPPEALQGRELTAVITALDAKGWLRRRRARFIPLRPSRDPSDRGGGVLALVQPEDATDLPHVALAFPSPMEAPDQEQATLHEQLDQFWTQTTGRYRFERLVGRSPAMHQARARIALASESLASVSIFGPLGSGREHVARAIHYGRGDVEPGTLFPIDCAVLGADLIEATLRTLAHRPAASRHNRPATLLLLDVDCLPADVQRSVASLLATGHLSHRIIATSQTRLSEAVREGRLREELAVRVSAIEIELPPLAARRADLPLLVQSLVEQLNATSAKQIEGLTSAALDRLDAYHWPGNVDELFASLEHARQKATGPYIDIADLPDRLHHAHDAGARVRKPREKIVLEEYLADIERRLIRRALELSKGNRSKAAGLLGINRPRLYRRLRQLGMEE